MVQVLADVKKSAGCFLLEAKRCARKQYGFAAMLTTFSVILGVAEAVKGRCSKGRCSNAKLFTWFVSEMDDRDSWIVLPESATSSEAVVEEKLAQIRDSLAHQFSLPTDVALVNSRREAKRASKQKRHMYIISTREFVDAVRKTVDKVIESGPDVAFDADPPGGIDRGAANRRVLTTGAPPISGSSTKGVIASVSERTVVGDASKDS